jgi:hypothetical protein
MSLQNYKIDDLICNFVLKDPLSKDVDYVNDIMDAEIKML